MTQSHSGQRMSKRQRYQGLDALAVQRLLSRLPVIRLSTLDQTALGELRGVLSDGPATLPAHIRDPIYRLIQPGRDITAEVIGQLMECLALPHDESDCERIAKQLRPQSNAPRTYRATALLPACEHDTWTVEDVLLALRRRRAHLSLNALLDLLYTIDWPPRQLGSAMEQLVSECVRSNTVSIGKIIGALEARGMPADLPLVLELHLAIKAGRAKSKAAQPCGDEIVRIKAQLDGHAPSYEAVKNAAQTLGYSASTRAVRRIAQLLRQSAPSPKAAVALSPRTHALLTLIANRTGLEQTMVVEQALILAAQSMVRAGKAQFPAALQQHLVRETIHAQFRALPAEAVETPVLGPNASSAGRSGRAHPV